MQQSLAFHSTLSQKTALKASNNSKIDGKNLADITRENIAKSFVVNKSLPNASGLIEILKNNPKIMHQMIQTASRESTPVWYELESSKKCSGRDCYRMADSLAASAEDNQLTNFVNALSESDRTALAPN